MKKFIILVLLALSASANSAVFEATHPGTPSITHLQFYEGLLYAGYESGNSTQIYQYNPVSRQFTPAVTSNSASIADMNVFDGNLYVMGTAELAVKRNGVWRKIPKSNIDPSVTRLRDFDWFLEQLIVAADTTGGAQIYETFDGQTVGNLTPNSAWKPAASAPIPNVIWCATAIVDIGVLMHDSNSSCQVKSAFSRFWLPDTGIFNGNPFVSLGARVEKVERFEIDSSNRIAIYMVDGRLFQQLGNTVTPKEENLTSMNSGLIWDFEINGSRITILRRNGQLCRSQNRGSWNCYDTVPLTARTLTTNGNRTYVGTSTGEIWLSSTMPITPILNLLLN